jgi:hypothetical protein
LAAGFKDLQHLAQIKETGEYDEGTKWLMGQARCGVGARVPGAPASLQTAPGTWDHTHITYSFDNFMPDIVDTDSRRKLIQEASEKWAKVTPLTSEEINRREDAYIKIKFGARRHGDSFPSMDLQVFWRTHSSL